MVNNVKVYVSAFTLEDLVTSISIVTSSPRQHGLFISDLIRWHLSLRDDLIQEMNCGVHMVYRMGLIAELIGNTMIATQEYTYNIINDSNV